MIEEDKIELRSEKVRNIIGQIPNRIIRYGTVIISLTIIILFIIISFIKYPITVSISVKVYTQPTTFLIKSPTSGKIYFKHIGDNIKQFDTIASIENITNNHFQFVNLISPKKGRLLINNTSSTGTCEKDDIIAEIIPDTILSYFGLSLIPFEYINKIKIGQNTDIELSGYPSADFGFLRAKIVTIFPFPVIQNGKSYFKVNYAISDNLNTSDGKKLNFFPDMEGKATIIICEKSILRSLLDKSNY